VPLIEADWHTTQDTFGWLPRVALEEDRRRDRLPFSRCSAWPASTRNSASSPWASTSSASAWAPPATWPARPGGEAFAQELDIAVGGTPRPTCCSRCRRSTASAPAPWPRAVRIGDDDTRGRVTPQQARKIVRQIRRRRPEMAAGSKTGSARQARIVKALKAAYKPEFRDRR